jgi:hypothetical protein
MKLLAGSILLVAVLLGSTGHPHARAAGAVAPPLPHTGLMEVVAYGQLNLDGNRGPVTVVLDEPEARVIRRELEALAPWNATAECMEELQPFAISFVPRRGAPPTVVVSADNCGGPHLSIADGPVRRSVADDCALQRSVLAAIPRGKAEGTRTSLTASCGNTARS